MAGPFQAHGTTISYGSGSPGTYTPIALVQEIGGYDGSVGEVDTTALASNYHTSIPGLPDGGTATFTIQYDPSDTTHEEMSTLFQTPVMTAWKLTYPNASTQTFNGYVVGFAPAGFAVESLITAEVSIRISGSVTFTP